MEKTVVCVLFVDGFVFFNVHIIELVLRDDELMKEKWKPAL